MRKASDGGSTGNSEVQEPAAPGPLRRLMRSRVRAFLRSERGQTMAIYAIAMVALLGTAAMVLDLGMFLGERRQLQNAADGAALAAARHLPASPILAETAADDYLTRNGFDPSDVDVQVVLTSAFSGDIGQFEVIVQSSNLPFFFGRALGYMFKNVEARAVAQVITSFGDEYAIFALNSDCSEAGVTVSGTDGGFVGIVHSNGNLTVSGGNHTFTPAVTFGCDFTENGGGHTYGRGQVQVGDRDLPASYTYSHFTCDFTFTQPNVNLKSQAVWQDPQKTVFIDGTYCFEGNVTLVGNDLSGTVSFIAQGRVSISGSDADFTANDPSGVLIFSAYSGNQAAVDISGSGGAWTGDIVAPAGHVDISGQSNQALLGSVLADTVSLAGNGLTITTNAGNNNTNPVVRLIE